MVCYFFGQMISDQTKQEISCEINKLEPPIHIHVNYVAVKENKCVIVIHAKHHGAHVPYVYDGRPFQRIQSSTIRMPQHMYDQLIARACLHFSLIQMSMQAI